MADSLVQALLRRCDECWEDGAGVDIGAEKLEALTALGFLSKRRAGRHGNVYTFTEAGNAEMNAPDRASQAGAAVNLCGDEFSIGDLLYRIDSYGLAAGINDSEFRSNVIPILEDIRGLLSGSGYSTQPSVGVDVSAEMVRDAAFAMAAEDGGEYVIDHYEVMARAALTAALRTGGGA